MCNFEKGFILCTCSMKEIESSDGDTEYIWHLSHFLGPNEDSKMGKYLPPVSDIGKGLEADFVQSELNKHNCFDFEYKPSDGDNLVIYQSSTRFRLEFIYRNDAWIEDHYSPFDHDCKEFKMGLLQSNE